MGIVSPGFYGRRRPGAEKLPPGQYLVTDFPVLSAGPTPRVDLASWELRLTTETGQAHAWDWAAFRALPSERITVDLHCVTKWSKLRTPWRGVSLDTLMEQVETTGSKWPMSTPVPHHRAGPGGPGGSAPGCSPHRAFGRPVMSTHLDGNVLGGELGELFTVDITAATGQCVSCGATSAIAQTRVYADAPGLVARCPGCGEIMLRLVRGPGRAWLDLRGVTCLQLAVPGQT